MGGADKPLIVTAGNCQSTFIGRFLKSLPEISRDYEVARFEKAEFAPGEKDRRRRLEHFLAANRHRIVAVIHQVTHDWAGLQLTQNDLGPGVVFVRYPLMVMSFVWPLMPSSYHQRLQGWKHGVFRNTLADDLVLRLRDQGVPRERLLEAYFEVDVVKRYRVDRLREINAAKCRQIDAASDFGIWNRIEERLASEQLFRTANHPDGQLLAFALERITERLPFISDREFLRMRLDQVRQNIRIQDEEAPVHPQVARHFELKWAIDARFNFWGEGALTFEEWLFRLYDERYDTGVDAAKKAWSERRVDDAARLFGEAVQRHPQSAALQLSLASVLIAAGDLAKGHDALRAAFAIEPTALVAERLFNLLRRQERKDEAADFVAGLEPALKSETGILLCRALVAREQGDQGLSKALIDQADATNPLDSRVALARAEEADREKRDADALRFMSRAHYLSNWSPSIDARYKALTRREALRQQAPRRQSLRTQAAQPGRD